MIDVNNDVRSQARIKFFNDLDMREINLERHGRALPRIQNRGQRPIDGLYLSLDLDVSVCGYLRFGKGPPSDHRLLWFYIITAYLLGHDLDRISKVAERRLKCNDPPIRKKYEAVYEEFINTHKILKRTQVLAKVVQEQRWVLVHGVEYEQLDDLRIQVITRASKKCRKLMMEKNDWSPTAQFLREVILFCKLCLRRAQGCRVSKSYHRSVQKKANLLDMEVPLMIDALISILKTSGFIWKKFAKDEANKA
jgi:hypothetical protein